jgi:hypothetical protein
MIDVDDPVRWSKRQAALLLRLAQGRPSKAIPDWTNIIAAVADVAAQVRARDARIERAALDVIEQRLRFVMAQRAAIPDDPQ